MPVERMRMRPWLEEAIDNGEIPGLKWVNKEKKIFQIPWMHAARHGWDVEKDAPLFRNWAIHTGKYQPGVDNPDPKTWKANFRCAMNSLPDIVEVKDKSMKKGSNAFRVYRMLSQSERPHKKGKKRGEKGAKWDRGSAESDDFMMIKLDGVADSTVVAEPSCASGRCCLNEQLIINDLPDVCQTIEVTTEDEEQSVSSSHHYPLQISPASSNGESDTESIHSDDDTKKSFHVSGFRSKRKLQFSSSVLKMPTCPLPGMATFVTAGKKNFKVTSSREDSPLIAYNSTHWGPLFPTTSTRSPVHENRASVIMKTSDISTSTVKTC